MFDALNQCAPGPIRIRATLNYVGRPGSIEENFDKKRGGHKVYVTKIINEAKMLISMENPKNKVKLTALLKPLRDRKDVICNLDGEILAMSTDGEIEGEIMTSGDCLPSTDETIFGITDTLEKIWIDK